MKDLLRAEVRRFGNTVVWSLAGWRACWATEKSLRQWTAVNGVSAVLAFLVPMTAGERALILALGLLVLAAELMNSALEETVDYISTDQDPRAGKAKDAGSAAVALTALAGGVAWVVVLVG
jgi:diacylglycerol kinase (ATP)